MAAIDAQNHHAADTDSETRLEKRIFLAVLAAVVLWGGSIVTWGVPGLYIPALCMVPVMYAILILISRG